jgi:UDP-N-acetylmuramoyl-tripeptide--D-alanyl-D-alanine ligase
MEPLGWHDLATAVQGRLVPERAWGRCTVISTDSRTLNPGDVFWALPGERHDGHAYIPEAVSRGAALIVGEAARCPATTIPQLHVADPIAALGRLARWHRRGHEALVIGVTGSVGKTTTKELVHAALSAQFQGLRSPGNYNNQIGLPKSLLELTAEHEFAVFELGASRVGEIRALAAIAEPEIGIITAIGQAHWETFGGVEGIIQGKGELLEALPATGFAVLPGDDPVTRGMASRAKCRSVFVGTGPDNDLVAKEVVASPEEVRFTVDGVPFRVALPGPTLLSNALCAIAVAREVGVPLERIAEGLEAFEPLAGRGRLTTIGPWRVIDDSYNASPLSVIAACERLALYQRPRGGRLYAVLGDMRELGAVAVAEHRRVGALLAGLPITGLLAYGEHARDYADGALRGGWRHGQIAATTSLDVLLTVLDCWLEPGDTVLVKGSRAMQLERVLDWLRQRATDMPTVRRSA